MDDFACQIVQNVGQKYSSHLKLVSPRFIVQKRYELVVIHIEDVSYTAPANYNWTHHWHAVLHLMKRHEIDVVTPLISGNHHKSVMNDDMFNSTATLSHTCPGLDTDSCMTFGLRPRFIEIFATVFRPLSWICFWDMLDVDTNEGGWGYDFCLSKLCDAQMAVLTRWRAVHSQLGGRQAGQKDRHGDDEAHQMSKWRARIKSEALDKDNPHHFFVSDCDW